MKAASAFLSLVVSCAAWDPEDRLGAIVTRLSAEVGAQSREIARLEDQLEHRAAAAPAPAATSGTEEEYQGCVEMCKHKKGLGAGSCMTDCRAETDSARHRKKALKEFVEDNTYNEAGGEDMEKAYEDNYDEKILSCHSDFESTPRFVDMDMDGDGFVGVKEAIAFGKKMCIPDEMIMQMFHQADRNGDKKIDPVEYGQAGEDTVTEKAVDAAVDKIATDPDEHSETRMPAFEEFDADENGQLDDAELEEVLMFEFHRRFPDASKKEVATMTDHMLEELSGVVEQMDGDGDGFITKAEYNKMATGRGGQELGDEMREAQATDFNREDPDDLHRVSHPPAAPAVAFGRLLADARKSAPVPSSGHSRGFLRQALEANRQSPQVAMPLAQRIARWRAVHNGARQEFRRRLEGQRARMAVPSIRRALQRRSTFPIARRNKVRPALARLLSKRRHLQEAMARLNEAHHS